MTKDDVKNKIEVELKKREKSVRNKNAIDKFLGLFPTLDALWGVLVGSRDALELEKQKLTFLLRKCYRCPQLVRKMER